MSGLLLRKDISQYGSTIVLITLLAIAFWLRFRNLGALGLYGDEDLTYIAVKGVLEHGYPITPSGIIYPRGIIFTYLSSISALFLGLSEFSLRLPSVIFSILVIIILYIFVKDIFGEKVAIVSGILYSLSSWDIEMSRHARMYEVYLFFYLLSTYFFYKGFLKGSERYRIATPFLFVITMSIHSLGLMLLVCFLCPLLIKDYAVISKRKLLFYGCIIALADFICRILETSSYSIAISKQSIANTAVDHAGRVVPDITLAHGLFSSMRFENIFLISIILLLCIFFLVKQKELFVKDILSLFNLISSVLIVITVLFQQYGLSLWIFAYSLYREYEGFSKLKKSPHKTILLFLGSSFIIWLFWGLYVGAKLNPGELDLATVKGVMLTMVDYPFITLRWFHEVMPVMTFGVIISLLILFDRSSKKGGNDASIIITVGFVGPLLTIGFMRAWPWDRYVYMVYPFFVTLFAWLIIDVTETVISGIFKMRLGSMQKPVVTFISVVLAFFLSNYHSFSQAKSISDRQYATDMKENKIFGYARYPDHKSAMLFVKDNMKSDDLIIAMDNLIAYSYLHRVDFLLRTEGIMSGLRIPRDIIIGTSIIQSFERLEEILHAGSNRRVWLITSAELIGPHMRRPSLASEIIFFLQNSEDKIVFTAKDDFTSVYLWK